MLVCYSSAVADIAIENGTDSDDSLDPLVRLIAAEERASLEYDQCDTILTRNEFINANRHNFI